MSNEITAGMVKELRERTGAGMMECKKALVAAAGNVENAIKKMREDGVAKADKKSGRVAAEGVVVIQINDLANQAVMLEINSETDFVARDATFGEFATAVSCLTLDKNIHDIAALNIAHLPDGASVDEARKALVSKLGENVQLRRLASMHCDESSVIGSYLHGTRIGVLVKLKGGDATLAKDLAMHIAANRPSVILPSQVSEDLIANERDIFSVQAKESGKPAEIIAKMIDGRIAKFLDEVSLVGQPFVKDPSQKVSTILKEKSAEVLEFTCFIMGEGIEKEESNFAEEVMAQVRGN